MRHCAQSLKKVNRCGIQSRHMCKFQPKFYDIDVSRYLSLTSLFLSLGTDMGLRYECYLITFSKGGKVSLRPWKSVIVVGQQRWTSFNLRRKPLLFPSSDLIFGGGRDLRCHLQTRSPTNALGNWGISVQESLLVDYPVKKSYGYVCNCSSKKTK